MTKEEINAMSIEEFKAYINTELDKVEESYKSTSKREKKIFNAWSISIILLGITAVICERKCYRNGLNTGYTMGKKDGAMDGYKDAMKIMRWRS